MDKLCLIISGGEYHAMPRGLKQEEADFVIACDKGWQYAVRLGLKPDLVVGDFDSAPPPSEWPLEQVPSRKDDTDTMLAVKAALKAGYRDIAILCALGGRLDHSLANLQAGAYIVKEGGRARLYGKDTEAFVTGPASFRLPRREGWSLSLFSLSERCEDLHIKGSKYDGDGLILENCFPLGVSNYWTEPEAELSFGQGVLLIVESKLKKGEHI